MLRPATRPCTGLCYAMQRPFSDACFVSRWIELKCCGSTRPDSHTRVAEISGPDTLFPYMFSRAKLLFAGKPRMTRLSESCTDRLNHERCGSNLRRIHASQEATRARKAKSSERHFLIDSSYEHVAPRSPAGELRAARREDSEAASRMMLASFICFVLSCARRAPTRFCEHL